MASPTLAAPAIPDLTGIPGVSDVELLRLGGVVGAGRRAWDVAAARVAAEVARRSSVGAGYEGLAQRSGVRTPEALVARLVGVTTSGARELGRVGGLLDGDSPWLAGVARAVEAGEVSVGAADAIGRGLGDPGADVAADDLADAAAGLLERAAVVPPEQLQRLARATRDAIDVAGVAERERAMYEARYVAFTELRNGMTRIHGLLDPESAAEVRGVVDRLTTPRRGGPRFVDPTLAAEAQKIVDDPRTTGQIIHDAFVRGMRRLDNDDDQSTMPPLSGPGVVVHVTLADLEARAGTGRLDDGTTVSIETVERIACTTGTVPIVFDTHGNPLNKGRANRLFDRTQHLALAAKWGGCAIDTCTRPTSWTEAHHIEHWVRDRGKSNVGDGVLLCRHHHLLLHNNHWEIDRTQPTWRMVPPSGDPIAKPHDLIPKHPLTHKRQ